MSSISGNCTVHNCPCTEFLPSHDRPTHCALRSCQHIQDAHNISPSIINLDDDIILLTHKPPPKKVATNTSAMIMPASTRMHHQLQRAEAEVREHRAKISVAKGTTMSKFSTLVAHSAHEKREINIHEVACYLLLHHKRKQHATLFSAFHSLHLNPDEEILDWQEWLRKQVFDHPAWCTRADRRETELNPKLHIRVGAHSGKGIPPVELLQGSGKLVDLLRVTKSSHIPLTTSAKGKQKLVVPMIAITAYIRDKNDDSSEEERQLKKAPHSVTPSLFSELLPVTSTLPSRKRSTEDMSPKQKSTLADRDLKKSRSGGGLVDRFLAYSPEPVIKLEPGPELKPTPMMIKSELVVRTRAQARVLASAGPSQSTTDKVRVLEEEYVEEETEKDTSESDSTSDPDL